MKVDPIGITLYDRSALKAPVVFDIPTEVSVTFQLALNAMGFANVFSYLQITSPIIASLALK